MRNPFLFKNINWNNVYYSVTVGGGGTCIVCDSAPAVTSLVTVDHAPIVTLHEQEK